MAAEIHKPKKFLSMLEGSDFLIEAIERAATLNLPQWWIVGGVIRDIVWRSMSGATTPLMIKDIDLLFHDPSNVTAERDRWIQQSLSPISGVPWSVKNQARMHTHNNDVPYMNMNEAMYCFPETISAIGIKKGGNERLIFTTCFGFDDLFSMIFRPTPHFCRKYGLAAYLVRTREKGWLNKWPGARVQPW
jgi:uncharacterized protein